MDRAGVFGATLGFYQRDREAASFKIIMANAELQIILNAIDRASEPIKRVGAQIQSMERQFKAVGTALTVFGGAVVGSLTLAVKAAADAELQMAKVNTIVKTLTGSFDINKTQIMEAANASLRLAGVDNELAAVSIARLSQVLGNVNKGIEMHKLALDLATVSGRDLESATTAIIQVLAGNSRVLKEFGIQVDEEMPKMEVLAMLQKRIGGATEEASDKLGTQLKVFKETFGNLMETIGTTFIPILNDLLKNRILPLIEKIQNWIDKHPELARQLLIVIGAVGALAAVLGPILIMLPGLITAFGLLTGPIGLVTIAIMALVAAGIYLWQNWDILKENLILIWNGIKERINEAIDAIKGFLEGLRQTFVSVWEGIRNVVGSVIDWISGRINDFLGLFDRFISIAQRVVSFVSKPVTSVVSAAKNLLGFRQFGGPVAPGQPFIVGEGGPELFIPSTFGRIVPDAGGGAAINITITGNTFMGDREVARKLGKELVDYLRLNLRV